MTAYDNIPEPLVGARRWVTFRVIPQPDGSLKKIPLTIRGSMARSDTPGDWCTLSEVRRAIQFDIGNAAAFALGEDYPLRVLDLDHCIDDRGNLSPLAVQIVSRAGIPTSKNQCPVTVYTFSYGGLKIIIRPTRSRVLKSMVGLRGS